MTPFIQILRDYANGVVVKPILVGSGKEIRMHWMGGTLSRVFNGGAGLINFAEMENGVLLINKLQCSKGELGEIERDLNIPYELVELGYPDYYQYGLSSIKVKYAKDKQRKEYFEAYNRDEITHDELWDLTRAL